MALHINLFFVLLFTNIALVLTVPELALADNIFFELDNQGNYVMSSEFMERLDAANPAKQEGWLDSASQVFSGLFLIFDFIGLLFNVLFSSIFILFVLPPTVALVVGIPLILAYGLALIGFIRG